MPQPFPERRKFPRLPNNVPVKICGGDFDMVTETANISCAGAYCKVNRRLELMTKLKIHLLLPIKKRNKITTKKISCEGVIVRSEQGSEGGQYNVAIYFSDFTPKDQKTLTEYINTSLSAKQT